ncbi:hypothetical protein N8I77_013250 [Diaporthe amygdali]|uniref:Nephrocystin 3-like N-terminal domain-containing protein n=1 Tax=Phomopsis amygdali TaxID=1214568 RepID=A0AAD9S2D0_PHOAM|nr:hypothetical protein N8I77_013250 [Diaporthe amygdali]
MSATEEIFHLTNACASLLAKCQSVPTLAKDDWIGRRLADFNLWAAGIRASTTGHASLDHRVRDRSDLKNVLLGILSTIEESAELCLDANIEPAQTPHRQLFSPNAKTGLETSWSDFSDSTDTSSSQQINNEGPLATEMSDISVALSQLYRITHLIKRSGKKHRFKRADREMPSRENDEEYIQLKKHLEFIILLSQQDVHTEFWKGKDWDERLHHVTARSELTPVHHALVKANMVRRNRIRYATQHLVEQGKASAAATESSEKQLEPDTGDDTTTAAEASGTNVLQQSDGGDSDIQDSSQPAALHVTDQDAPEVELLINAPMTATEIDTMPFISSQRAVNDREKGTIITRITRISVRQDYPPCPTKFGTFQCPYCAQALSGDYTNISQWRGHVKQDLMPYTCVFENCKSLETNELFESSEQWMAHLTNTHSETLWVCSICPAGPDGNDEAVFDSNGAWQNHIGETHPDTFPAHQLDQLAGMSERVSLPPMACPFCRHYDETEAQPYDHIANHLHEFALRALPWNDNPNGGSHSDSVASLRTEAGRGRLPRIIIDNDDFEGSDDDQPPMSRSDTMKQLLEQIADQAAKSLQLEIPKLAKGYQNVLEQLPILLDRTRSIGLNSASKGQHRDNKSADGAAMIDNNREDERKDKLDGYIRPLLRIQGIVHTFSEQMDHLSEREAKELEESLQDECAALRQLLDNEDPAIQTRVSISRVSESATENVSEIQKMIEAVVEKREVPLHESYPFFEEAFKAQIELTTVGERLQKHLTFDHTARCKVEDVERRFSEVFAEWEKHHTKQLATANIGRRLRGMFTRFSKLAARPNSLFAILPAPELAESVCGGMVMVVICICKRRSSDAFVGRSTDALTTISSAVTTEVFGLDVSQTRRKSEELSRKAAAMCTAIFRLLTAVIENFRHKKSSFIFNIISRYSAYDSFEPLSEQVRAAFNDLQNEATRILRLEKASLEKMMNSTRATEIQRLVGADMERMELLRRLVGETHKILANEIWVKKQTELDNSDAMRAEKVLGADDIYDLGAQPDLVDNTTRRILEHFRRRHSATDRILHLLNDKKLRNFIDSRSSSALLIRDEGFRRERGHLAVTFAAIMIVRWLRGGPHAYPNSQVYTLACFDNIEATSHKPRSARDIMIQLVSQLMLQYQGLTLSILDDLHSLEEADTGRLLKLFERLLQHLSPHSQVYCIIDAFDLSKPVTGNAEMLTSLLDLAGHSFSNYISVKVLLTSSKSAIGFRRHLDAGEILDMGLLKRSGGRAPTHLVTYQKFEHTAVGKVLGEIFVR